MKTLYAILIAAMMPFALAAQFNSENLSLADKNDPKPVALSDVQHGKLRLFPVYASDNFVQAYRDLGKFTTLKDAQAKNQVQITEHTGSIVPNHNGQAQNVGGGETVNTLYIENISKDTVYIMAGEVVKGGKQDRVIAQDMILPPNSGKYDISVFCVEHGRWTYKGGKEFRSAGYFTSSGVRKQVDVAQNQSGVWQEVAKTNEANKTSTNTDAYTANEDNKKFQDELKPYLQKFSDLAASDQRIVGVVAATDDRVIGCDIFATHDLFANQYQGLLNGYATEAIIHGAEVRIKEEKVQAYLDQFLKDEKSQEKNLEGKGKVQKLEINNEKRTLRLSAF